MDHAINSNLEDYMIIRQYEPNDCEKLANLFYNTVHAINAKDYSQQQLNVWATDKIDLEAWNKALSENYTVVAVENNIIVGFGDIDKSGYLDRLYVHKDYQRQGIATAICDKLEQAVEVNKIITHSSITAKLFFEQRGFKVVKEQQVKRNGIALTNYVMENKYDKFIFLSILVLKFILDLILNILRVEKIFKI